MPTFNEETFFYEVLLRFGDVVPNKGKLIGASLTQITQLLKDGVLLNTTINPPEQLSLVDGESGQKLSDVLGEANAATIIENQVLSENLRVEQTASLNLSRKVSEMQTEIDRLTEEIAAVISQSDRDTAAIASDDLSSIVGEIE